MPIRYFLDHDHDGRWYVIAHDRTEDWRKWKRMMRYSGENPALPDYVFLIGRSPEGLAFEQPSIDGHTITLPQFASKE